MPSGPSLGGGGVQAVAATAAIPNPNVLRESMTMPLSRKSLRAALTGFWGQMKAKRRKHLLTLV